MPCISMFRRRARLPGLAVVVVAVAASVLWALDADATVCAYVLALVWLGFTIVAKRLEPARSVAVGDGVPTRPEGGDRVVQAESEPA